MATVRRNTRNNKKKKKAPLPRKPRTGIGAAPTENFLGFSDYFRVDMTRGDMAGVLRNYVRQNYKGEEQKLLLSAPDYMYTSKYGTAASIAWKDLGKEHPAKWNHKGCVKIWIDEVRNLALAKLAKKDDSDKPKVPTVSPMERVRQITSDFIARIEEYVDTWQDHLEFDMYKEMQLADLNSFTASSVLKYYSPQRDEVHELVHKKTPDLLEGYTHLSVPQRKKYLAFFDSLVTDIERYVASKKASRKISRPRIKSADKQVAKVNYCKDSTEHKLTSINPMNIVGSRRLYTFHVKERMLTEFVTQSANGFEISGTTIKNYDQVNSRSVRLRKPEEMLGVFQTQTAKQIDKYWATLTTVTVKPTGRINKDMILLRVMDI